MTIYPWHPMPDFNIWTFRTKRFTVTVNAFAEDDLDLSWDEDGSTKRALECGDLVAFRVWASCVFEGEEIGCASLGNCVYESPAAFRDHMQPGHGGSYFKDMVLEACSTARSAFQSTRAAYNCVNIRERRT